MWLIEYEAPEQFLPMLVGPSIMTTFVSHVNQRIQDLSFCDHLKRCFDTSFVYPLHSLQSGSVTSANKCFSPVTSCDHLFELTFHRAGI